ncbi:carboxymuconolactone decarboxylase family protein [Halopseudomonas nanhaiensis]|uniref:carboxymuconolactone decarboxylase family protein n=1 Tax=Halopseudomonas nanhaiensis TaxID=2830842 RepID=UPI001CBD08B0|nr:carboxymuconolactone decarboxylase family protein [Halopseudomonas nanhaiensis]UAW97322.1 carboxymuconolactone decarboxylase family protein [Halopseudomonas nanhaiensis]
MLVPPLSFEQASPEAQAVLQRALRSYGRLPNLLASMAHSPATLQSYLGLTEHLQRTSLIPADRERIALTVSALNGCEYCQSAHAWLAQQRHLSPTDINQAIHRPDEHPLTRLAARLVRSSGALSQAHLADARSAGMTDEKLFEAVACIAWMHFSNYLGNLIKPAIDFPSVDTL